MGELLTLLKNFETPLVLALLIVIWLQDRRNGQLMGHIVQNNQLLERLSTNITNLTNVLISRSQGGHGN